MPETIALHEFEKAGLGKYPYQLTGVTENKFVVAAGTRDAHVKPGSSCDYCGTGIMYEFWCLSSDHKRFKVGCDCILRLGNDPELKAQAKREQLRMARESRTAKKIAENKARREHWEAEKADRAKTKKAEYLAKNADFIEQIRANSANNMFLASLLENFEKWGSLTEGQENAASKCLAIIAERAKTAQSQHVGNIGDKVELTLTTVKVIDITYYTPGFNGTKYAPYGPKSRYIMRDANGNVILYEGNSDKLPYTGNTGIVQGKVKSHGEYNGTKQTLIERPKLLRITNAAIEQTV